MEMESWRCGGSEGQSRPYVVFPVIVVIVMVVVVIVVVVIVFMVVVVVVVAIVIGVVRRVGGRRTCGDWRRWRRGPRVPICRWCFGWDWVKERGVVRDVREMGR